MEGNKIALALWLAFCLSSAWCIFCAWMATPSFGSSRRREFQWHSRLHFGLMLAMISFAFASIATMASLH